MVHFRFLKYAVTVEAARLNLPGNTPENKTENKIEKTVVSFNWQLPDFINSPYQHLRPLFWIHKECKYKVSKLQNKNGNRQISLSTEVLGQHSIK
jgi:hypothetical protein